MRLRYTADALAHLQSIRSYLADRNPAAARRVMAAISVAASRLCDFPQLGRSGESPGTREWVVQGSPYIVVYQVDADREEIRVLGVFHGAQDRSERSD